MHVSSLPGVAIAFASMPGRVRDLAVDLETLRDVHQTRLLVSVVEARELGNNDIGDIGVRARAMGIEWVHAPIPDFGVPPSVDDAVALVRRMLAVDGAVVVHCRGGLGRSGTIAACCLVGRGEAAEDAIRIVRAARAGAIENDAQEEFVRRFGAHFACDRA